MSDFNDPHNVEEALQRKRKIADEVTRLQSKQKQYIAPGVRDRVRQELKDQLERLYAEGRFLKDWLRQNATHKPSEYEMLARAYRVLTSLSETGIGITEDGEVLLSDIEMHVPHAYLIGLLGDNA